MTKDTPESAIFDITPYERPDSTVDEAWIDAFVEHIKTTGAYFDITPYERPDGTFDEAWIDAVFIHSAMRATARMHRVTEREDNDD